MKESLRKYFEVKTLKPDGHFVKEDKQEAEKIKKENHQYFYVALPVNMTRFETYHKSTGMDYYQWKKWVEENKPATSYMSFVVFKIVKFTPMSIAGGFFTAPKVVPTSLIVETMDGRQMEAYEMYTEQNKYGTGRNVLHLSQAVLNEVARNFAHPKLNFDNFHNYSAPIWYAESGEPNRNYVEFGTCDSDYIAPRFANWKEGKARMKAHFDFVLPHYESAQASQKARQQNWESEKARYKSELENAFGGGNNTSQYGVYACPTCQTNCRVPARGKKVEITCPKCGTKFVVLN